MTISLESFISTKTIVTPDNRGRIGIGSAHKDKSYMVSENDIGQVLLTPVAIIPAHELWLMQNKPVQESIARGVAQAAAGQGKTMDFSQYADLENED